MNADVFKKPLELEQVFADPKVFNGFHFIAPVRPRCRRHKDPHCPLLLLVVVAVVWLLWLRLTWWPRPVTATATGSHGQTGGRACTVFPVSLNNTPNTTEFYLVMERESKTHQTSEKDQRCGAASEGQCRGRTVAHTGQSLAALSGNDAKAHSRSFTHSVYRCALTSGHVRTRTLPTRVL